MPQCHNVLLSDSGKKKKDKQKRKREEANTAKSQPWGSQGGRHTGSRCAVLLTCPHILHVVCHTTKGGEQEKPPLPCSLRTVRPAGGAAKHLLNPSLLVPPAPPPLRSGLFTRPHPAGSFLTGAPRPGGPVALHEADRRVQPGTAAPNALTLSAAGSTSFPSHCCPPLRQTAGDPPAPWAHFQPGPDHPGPAALPRRPFPTACLPP